MLDRQADDPGSFCRSDPNCTTAADKRERTVADYLAILDRELDNSLRVRPRITEFVGNLKSNPRHIDPVGIDLVVIGRDDKLLIYSLT